MGRSAVKVGQLNQYIGRIMKTDPLLADISVIGEISNLKFHSSGHIYFSLKDDNSRVGCFLAAQRAEYISSPVEEGMEVIASGYISVYERGGSYSLNVQDVETGGIGQLAARFEELKKKLSSEGLFDPAIKKELPVFPDKIAVVTSPTGAAVRDILKILKSRNDYVDILIYPVLVQGPAAPGEISAAIDDINKNHKDVDIIITGRGGGSAEELWAFNEEPVVRSIYRSHIPVISAVGHETDVTLSDFAADVRAETPTAAAHMAVPDTAEIRSELKRMIIEMGEDMKDRAEAMSRHLEALDPTSFAAGLRTRMNYEQMHVDDIFYQMKDDMDMIISINSKSIAQHREIMETASPYRILERGYSFVTDKNGRILRSVDDISQGDSVKLKLSDGYADAEIIGTEKEVVDHEQ